MTKFGLQPVGEIEETILQNMKAALEQNYPVDVVALPPLAIDGADFDAQRKQYSAPLMLRRLLASVPEHAEKFLAVTSQDLFIPMLSFVYGQAQLNGRAALVSTARLHQEYYGLPGNIPLMLERSRKEAVHETGHLHALVHCKNALCPMSLSTNVRQLDTKTDQLCPACRALIWE